MSKSEDNHKEETSAEGTIKAVTGLLDNDDPGQR